MALALNVFKTVTKVVGTSSEVIYTAPVGYTGVVLLAQVTNIGATSEDVTVFHRRDSTDSEIVKEYPIPANDTLNLLSGKLVLESGDKLVAEGSNGTNLKFISSILETLQ